MNTIPAVKFFLTEVGKSPSGSPVVVGWDFCRCGYHISICQCVGGPTEPRYVTAMREKDAQLAAQPTTTAVASTSAPTAVRLATQVDESSGIGPFCTICHKTVDESNADPNDDGTYTCFTCQEAS